MTHSLKLSFVFAVLFVTTCAVGPVQAKEPPGDLCSLLPAEEVSKVMGQHYGGPEKSVAPRPYKDTAEGADCHYSSNGARLLFRAYTDPSPTASAELFAKLGKFYSPQTPVGGLGDEAYFDPKHGLHVRKGQVRFFLDLDAKGPAAEKQLKDLASHVVGEL